MQLREKETSGADFMHEVSLIVSSFDPFALVNDHHAALGKGCQRGGLCARGVFASFKACCCLLLVDYLMPSVGCVCDTRHRSSSSEYRMFTMQAREVLAVCRAARVPLLINDRVDVAMAVDADGVHVGQAGRGGRTGWGWVEDRQKGSARAGDGVGGGFLSFPAASCAFPSPAAAVRV